MDMNILCDVAMLWLQRLCCFRSVRYLEAAGHRGRPARRMRLWSCWTISFRAFFAAAAV